MLTENVIGRNFSEKKIERKYATLVIPWYNAADIHGLFYVFFLTDTD